MAQWFKRARSSYLGPLEMQVLSALHRRGNATVRELLDESGIDAAYTTVMTTVDRLYKKGFLHRRADGRAYRYRPQQTEHDFLRTVVGGDLKRLLAAGVRASVPISFLVDTVTAHDPMLLDELTREIERKRRELRERGEH